MKATMVIAALGALLVSCGGGKRGEPPPAGPAPVVTEAEPRPPEPAPPPEPSAAELGAVWGERVETAFVALTTKSVMPAPARATAMAAWTALDGAPDALPADDAALGAALRTRAAEQVGSKTLAPERVWAAIAAMAESTNNVHVMLLDAARVAQFGGSIEGQPFVTPGVMVAWTPDGELAVTEILPDAPAANAGLAVGDVILSIDGRQPRRVGPLFDVMFVEPGAKTVFGIRRGSTESKVTVTLASFAHPVGTHRVLRGGVGLLRLYFCGLGEAPDRNHIAITRAALADFDAKKVQRVVIDLRGNMGGGGVARWASIFTKDTPILFAREPADTEDYPWPREGDAWPKVRPIAVLVDEQTISCGEMLAYALAEHGVARLFGQPTGEAVNVPQPVDLGEGYLLMVPTADVFGPKTKPEGHRVTPDVVVANRTVAELMVGKDPQLDAALKWLAKQRSPK